MLRKYSISKIAVSLAFALVYTPTAIAATPIGQVLDRKVPTPFAVSTWTPSRNAHVPGLAVARGNPNGVVMDLTSSPNDVSLRGVIAASRTVVINMGGVPISISGKDHVTPAQLIAIKQVIVPHGVQTLNLNASGAATGGFFSLNGLINPVKTIGLTIPAGVTAIDNVARNRLLGVRGDVTNDGTLYFYSTHPRLINGLLLSANLQNNGLISSTVDSSLRSIVPSTYTLSPSVNYTLAAIENIVNTGIISSSGKLLLATAYGGISNISTPTNPLTTRAVITGMNDVTFSSGREAGSSAPVTFTNNGFISSSLGNVMFASPIKPTDLIFNFTNGTVEAANGAINIRHSLYTGTGNIFMNGGTYTALNGLNLYGGSGDIIANNATNNLTSAIIADNLRTVTTGDVDIVDDSTGRVSLGASTGNNFSLRGAGSVQVSAINATGDINVVADNYGTESNTRLDVISGGIVRTSNGDITLQNADGATGSINIGFGASISTQASAPDAGAIRIVCGTIPVTPNPGIAPGFGVAVNDISNDGVHQVYWGDNSITAFGPTNTLNIKGQDIIFNAATSSSQITLQGFVNITADPVALKEASDDGYVVDTADDGTEGEMSASL